MERLISFPLLYERSRLMKKRRFMLTIALIFTLILSSCTFDKQNSIESPKSNGTSSISNSEMEQKTNSDVKFDTDKEFARYKELYPNETDIADLITPVIQKSEGDNKGYTEYVINFLESYPFTLTIELPEQLSTRLYSDDERLYASLKDMGVQPFYSSAVGICDKENNIIGGISSTTIMCPDDLVKGANNSVVVYQGLFTGMGNTWDLGYKQISLTETECTATTYICYPDYGIKDVYPRDYARLNNMPDLGGERYFLNKAILSYNTDKLKYVAIEIDFDCISDEELLSVAKSIKLS